MSNWIRLCVWYDKIQDYGKLNSLQKVICDIIYRHRLEEQCAEKVLMVSAISGSKNIDKNFKNYMSKIFVDYEKHLNLKKKFDTEKTEALSNTSFVVTPVEFNKIKNKSLRKKMKDQMINGMVSKLKNNEK